MSLARTRRDCTWSTLLCYQCYEGPVHCLLTHERLNVWSGRRKGKIERRHADPGEYAWHSTADRKQVLLRITAENAEKRIHAEYGQPLGVATVLERTIGNWLLALPFLPLHTSNSSKSLAKKKKQLTGAFFSVAFLWCISTLLACQSTKSRHSIDYTTKLQQFWCLVQ